MGHFVVDHGVFVNDEQEIEPHMNQQENDKKNSSQRHQKFLPKGRGEYSRHMITIKISYLNCKRQLTNIRFSDSPNRV